MTVPTFIYIPTYSEIELIIENLDYQAMFLCIDDDEEQTEIEKSACRIGADILYYFFTRMKNGIDIREEVIQFIDEVEKVNGPAVPTS